MKKSGFVVPFVVTVLGLSFVPSAQAITGQVDAYIRELKLSKSRALQSLDIDAGLFKGTAPSKQVLQLVNKNTQLCYSLAEEATVELDVFNAIGQKVKTLVNEKQSAGSKQVAWDGVDSNGSTVANGIYYYCLKVGLQSTGPRTIIFLD